MLRIDRAMELERLIATKFKEGAGSKWGVPASRYRFSYFEMIIFQNTLFW